MAKPQGWLAIEALQSLFNSAGSALKAVLADKATALATARTIDGIPFDGSADITIPRYGTCTTAAGTAAKVGTLAEFTRFTGAIVGVKFSAANTHASPTLNVNSTGAAAIYYQGAYVKPGMIGAATDHLFQFNGSQWELLNPFVNVIYAYGSIVGSVLARSYGITAVTIESPGVWNLTIPGVRGNSCVFVNCPSPTATRHTIIADPNRDFIRVFTYSGSTGALTSLDFSILVI